MNCKSLAELIEKSKYFVRSIEETPKGCIITFSHPTIKPEERTPELHFLSAVRYDKEKGSLEATVRRKVKGFKELYLDYCCENGEMSCRPHVSTNGDVIFSVEAKFSKNALERFKNLLNDIF